MDELQALRSLIAEAESMGATEYTDSPHVIIAMDIPVDEYDDPTDPGIIQACGPFPDAVTALAAAERHEAQLNRGSKVKMFRVIAVPLFAGRL